MVVSAHDVAAALRERVPGLPVTKLHKLLYYCQGHHLATFGEPLFSETISAWDMGPVVGTLWKAEKDQEPVLGYARMTERELNTVGYIVSRYGRLSAGDLVTLTHNEPPWQMANQDRPSGTTKRIDPELIRDHFVARDREEASEGVPLDAEEVRQWLADAGQRYKEPGVPDDLDELRDRVETLRAKLAARG